MITYINRYNANNDLLKVEVKLDGKKSGVIIRVDGGWKYFPIGQRASGQVLPSVAAVMRSLEGE